VIIAFASGINGTGTSTVTINLGTALADLGLKVALIDLDYHVDATRYLVDPRDPPHPTIADVLNNVEPAKFSLRRSRVPNLWLLAGAGRFKTQHDEHAHWHHVDSSRARRLEEALRSVEARADIVLVDCAGRLYPLAAAGALASDMYVTPVWTDGRADRALQFCVDALESAASDLQCTIPPRLGIVLCRLPARHAMARDVAAIVRRQNGAEVFRTVLRDASYVSEAVWTGRSMLRYAPGSTAAIDLRAFILELAARLERIGGHRIPLASPLLRESHRLDRRGRPARGLRALAFRERASMFRPTISET
jgi:cellulose biosynthesis protein BcsQ